MADAEEERSLECSSDCGEQSPSRLQNLSRTHSPGRFVSVVLGSGTHILGAGALGVLELTGIAVDCIFGTRRGDSEMNGIPYETHSGIMGEGEWRGSSP